VPGRPDAAENAMGELGAWLLRLGRLFFCSHLESATDAVSWPVTGVERPGRCQFAHPATRPNEPHRSGHARQIRASWSWSVWLKWTGRLVQCV
jgi:hypothetical protein